MEPLRTVSDANALAPKDAAETGKKKRRWSAGENVFNYGVYGGISWIVNEILSTIITESIYKGGRFYKPFEKTVDFLHKNANPMKWGRRIHYLTAEMFVMCLGGTFLVPPVKWLEDRKGKIVRGLDKMFHGGKQDPKLEAMHQEMEEAPKQSWSSLWKGRLLVLVAAITMHFTMGAENEAPHKRWVAPTTHLFKGTFMEKYSNLTRAMQTLTRDLLRLVHPDKTVRSEITKFRFPSAETLAKFGKPEKGTFIPIQASEGMLAGRLGNTFGYVLSVSAAMATLFFVSSRIFAASRDKKQSNTTAQEPIQLATEALPPAAEKKASKAQRDEDTTPATTITQVDARSSLKAAASIQLTNHS